jgi:hypothetical protein
MNRIIFLFIFVLFILNVKTDTNAQCKQQFVYRCAQGNGNAIYLKDFNVKLRLPRSSNATDPDAYKKFSMYLNRGTNYRFDLCADPDLEGKVEFNLYKSQAATAEDAFLTDENKGVSSFIYECERAGQYYLVIKLVDGVEDNTKGCAVAILSFVGKS